MLIADAVEASKSKRDSSAAAAEQRPLVGMTGGLNAAPVATVDCAEHGSRGWTPTTITPREEAEIYEIQAQEFVTAPRRF